MWSPGLLDDLLRDARFALRALRRDAGFTVAVVLTLALGIGANTAIFSIVNAVMLQPLPYAKPEQLVAVWIAPTGSPNDRDPASLPDIVDWQQRATGLQGLAGYAFNRFELGGTEGEDQARAVLGTATLYAVLGARPMIGRLPRPDEERLPVVTISHRLWIKRYARNPNVLGKALVMNGQPYTIVGVMPPGFHFPRPDIDLWATMFSIMSVPTTNGPNLWLTSRSLHGYSVVARLAPGVTPLAAERMLNRVQRELAAINPADDAGVELHVQSVRDDSIRSVRTGLWTMFAAAGLILLLACVNVAHLLLARMGSRTRELAVRRALGADRARIARQLVTESVMLGLLGGGAGVGVAQLGTRALVRLSPGDIPRLENVGIDGWTLGFAVVVSIATGLLFGVGPAVVGWSRDMQATFGSRGNAGALDRQGSRMRAVLTAAEVAFALVLLVGAGLMVRSLVLLTSADLGIDTSGVAAVSLTFTGARYESGRAKTRTLDRILAQLRATPGVIAAGASTSMPPSRIQEIEGITVERAAPAAPGHQPTAIYIPATPGYLGALHIPLDRGRDFGASDDSVAPPVAIVSRELVRRYFDGRDPIGRRVTTGGDVRTVIGVAGDAAYQGVGMPIQPTIYVPFAQRPFAGVWIAIRSKLPTGLPSLSLDVRQAIRAGDRELAAHEPQALESMVGESTLRPRFHTWLLGSFGALALLLASVGIYGVIAYGVSQRRSEIGIRLALGAPTRSVVSMVLRGGMPPVVVGLAIGLALSIALSRSIASLLYGIAPTDVPTFAIVTLVLGMTALVAAYVPARRASRVDPLTTIRAE